MKLCILGNANSPFVINFLTHLISKIGISRLYLLTKEKNILLDPTIIQYEAQWSIGIIKKIPKIRVILRILKEVWLTKKMPYCDIYHMHFVDWSFAFYSGILEKKCKSFVCSVWGSDFYKSSRLQRKLQERLYRVAKVITFANEVTKDQFNKYYKERYKEKLRLCRFGLAPLDELRKLTLSKEDCKKKLGIYENAIVVVVGYNNSPAQQHLEVIDSLMEYSNLLPSNILLLFPMAYGGSVDYKDFVKQKLYSSGLKYKIIDNFMSSEDVALLRKSADIMIQVQKTDQFSGSMQEHIFARNVVITGSWLPYGILEEKGVFLLKISTVEEVGEKLLNVFKNLDAFREKCNGNPEIIWELSSWDKNIHSWIEIYDELMQKGKDL